MTSKTPLEPGELQGRQLILREAARLFFTAGYSSTSISRIADATGMVKSAIYHHFSSKDNLYLAVISELVGRLAARLNACTCGETWRAQLDSAAHCLAQFFAEERLDLPAILRDLGQVPSIDVIAWRNRLAPDVLAPITHAIEQGIAAGEIAAIDPVWATWLLAVIAAASSMPLTRDPATDATQQALDVFLRGIGARR